MNITVEDKSKVDKVLKISATREELEPRFDKAYRAYRKKINMPGFRPGQMPLSIIKKRFGKEIETEEINGFVQEVFRDEIVPKYDPVGEPQFEDMVWEDGKLEVTLEIGVKPEFKLKDLSEFSIDKMVHDVSDEEVDKEVQSSLERGGIWKETQDPVQENSRVTVDAVPLDKDGAPVDEEKDVDKEMDLGNEEFKDFREALKGAVNGETREVVLGEGDDVEKFGLTLKKVMKLEVPELDEEFVRKATREEVSSVEEYRSRLRSQIQNYYDQVSSDMIRQEIMEKLIDAHEKDIDVAHVVLKRFQQAHLDRLKQQNESGSMPEDFNEEEYLDSVKEDARKEARWAFIAAELNEKYKDIEISPEDIDARLSSEAARYGLPMEMVKNFYAQSSDQIENLRQNIRTDKLFDRLISEITFNELDKEAYQEKKKKERKENSDL